MIYGFFESEHAQFICAIEWKSASITKHHRDFTYDGLLRWMAIIRDAGCLEAAMFVQCNTRPREEVKKYMEEHSPFVYYLDIPMFATE